MDNEFNYIIKGHPLSKMNGITCKINRYEDCMSYFKFARGCIPVKLDREIEKCGGGKSNKAFIKDEYLHNKIFQEETQ